MAVIEAIATTYLEADAASVTFTSIPATYEHLQVRCSTRATVAAAGSAFEIEFNGSVGTAYSTHAMAGATSSVYGLGLTGEGYWRLFDGTHGTSVVAGEYAALIVDVFDYVNSNKNTTAQALYCDSVTLAGNQRVTFGSGLWDDTAAITQIKFTPSSGSLVRGSEFTLYGLNSS